MRALIFVVLMALIAALMCVLIILATPWFWLVRALERLADWAEIEWLLANAAKKIRRR